MSLSLHRRLAATAIVASIALRARAAAQGSVAADPLDAPVCYGFAFGAWTPALDLATVGQRAVPPAKDGKDRTPADRDWAAPSAGIGADSTLVLFPRWWPPGVSVALPGRVPPAKDTVVGVATALVPRGDITPPTAPVRAWRVPCTPRDTSLEQAVEAVDLPTRDGIASPAAHLPYYRIYRVRELP